MKIKVAESLTKESWGYGQWCGGAMLGSGVEVPCWAGCGGALLALPPTFDVGDRKGCHSFLLVLCRLSSPPEQCLVLDFTCLLL